MTSLFSISLEEKKILYHKYVRLGNSPDEAALKVNGFTDYLKDLKIKLKKRNLPQEDINTRFKREFEILCQRLDAGEDYLKRLKK